MMGFWYHVVAYERSRLTVWNFSAKIQRPLFFYQILFDTIKFVDTGHCWCLPSSLQIIAVPYEKVYFIL